MATTFDAIRTGDFARQSQDYPTFFYRGLTFDARELERGQPRRAGRSMFYRGLRFAGDTPDSDEPVTPRHPQFYRGVFFCS